MIEWLFTVGIFTYIAATVLSVLEEWPKQGLTDTSYLALLLWLAASVTLLAASAFAHYMALVIVAILSIIVTGYALKLKLYDHRHILKGLSLYALRRQNRL